MKKMDISESDIVSVKADSIMIGEMGGFCDGKTKAGIESVGLRYGFAEKDELENAGADYILEKVEDILPFLNQM